MIAQDILQFSVDKIFHLVLMLRAYLLGKVKFKHRLN